MSEPVSSAERPAARAAGSAGWAEVAFLAGVTIAAVLLVVWAMQLWRADLNVPFVYSGDGMATASAVKSIQENGTYWVTPRLGAPGELELYDFPPVAGWHYLVLRFLLLFMPAYPLGLNVFYLLGYPLAALAAAWALRRLGLGRVPAGVAALLFAVMPYHFVRGEGHLFLSEYYFVPVALLLAIECASAAPPEFPLAGWRSLWRRPEATTFFGRNPIWALAAVAAISSCDIYYGFFTAMFVALACAYGLVRHRRRAYAGTAAVLLGVILLATALNLAPSFVYHLQNGPNPQGLARNPGQAEVYGLKLDQMLLPVDGHRVGKLAALKAAYHEGMRRLGPYLDNEAVAASPLGVVGSVGLLFLFAWTFVAFARGPERLTAEGDVLGRVGMLTVSSFVVATVGGISALVAFVLPQIRAYNRVSIFLAFLALTAVAFGLDRLRGRGFALMAAVSAVVLAIAVLDQVSPAFVPDYAALSARFRSDGAFVSRVEKALPKGAAVLELPYMPFPEPGGPVVGIAEYEPIMPYLHSTDLRWSYGAMKGRPTDALIQRVSATPAAELPAAARQAGYGAIWLDTAGYADHGAEMERGLEAAGLKPALTSADGRWIVYPL